MCRRVLILPACLTVQYEVLYKDKWCGHAIILHAGSLQQQEACASQCESFCIHAQRPSPVSAPAVPVLLTFWHVSLSDVCVRVYFLV